MTNSQPENVRTPSGRRILFGVFQTGRFANGGVESVSILIEGLTGWQRTVVTNLETPFCERWRRSGAKVVVWRLPYRVGESFRAGGPLGWVRRSWSLLATNAWALLKSLAGEFEVLHCNDPAPFWHFVPAARLTGRKVILNLRDTKTSALVLDRPRYRRRFGWCDHVLVLSKEMKNFYELVYAEIGCPGNGIYNNAQKLKGRQIPIGYIYSIVDQETMRPLGAAEREQLRARLRIRKETFAVAFVAAFGDKKNQLGYLQNAVPALRTLCPQAITFFVGDFTPSDNSYARKCEDFAKQEQLANVVRMVGFTPAVHEWLQACDVVVVPTKQEGLARCMIEAIACGTPVVSFDVCSAAEILERYQCGRVVRQGDYQTMILEISKLAATPLYRNTLATNGVLVARKLFNVDKVIRQYRKLVLDLVDGKGRSH